MKNGTVSSLKMAVDVEGISDALTVLKNSHDKGEWIMIAPDGRVWQNKDPTILFAALASILSGEILRFGNH